MAVVIRLARHGRKKRPFYRVVVADKQKSRDGRYLEKIGTFDPLQEPVAFELEEERLKYWVSHGAVPSDTVAQLVEKRIPGYLSGLEEGRLGRIRSRRAARKARAKAK